MEHQKPMPELKTLNFLIGNWYSEGEVSATSKEPVIKIKGTDKYEWVLDDSFILHSVDVIMGDEKIKVIEIIGYDKGNNKYILRSFNNQGSITEMQAQLDTESVLLITGDKMRSKLSVHSDSNYMTAHWEKSEDGITWFPWMDMNFKK
jgi:hypothetical protein